MNWNTLKNKRRFVALLRQVAIEELHWSSPYNCGIGILCKLDGDKMLSTDGMGFQYVRNIAINPFGDKSYKLWCMSGNNESMVRLNKRYGLTDGHIRAIEMTNDMSVIMRLAEKDIYPPSRLYKNKVYMQTYINELANLVEEVLPKKKPVKIKKELVTVPSII